MARSRAELFGRIRWDWRPGEVSVRELAVWHHAHRRAAGTAFPPDQTRRTLAAVWSTSPARATSTPPGTTAPTRAVRLGSPRHSSYRVERPVDTGTRCHGPAAIRLVNLPATAMIN